MVQRQPQSFDYCIDNPFIIQLLAIYTYPLYLAALHAVSKDNSLPALEQESDDVTNNYSSMIAADCLPASVQEDGDGTNNDLPVMAGEFSFLFLLYALFIFGFFIII